MAGRRCARALVALLLSLALAACGLLSPEPEAEAEPRGKVDDPVVEPVAETVVEPEAEPALLPKPVADYTWDELSQIAGLIEAAGSVEEGRGVAQEFGLLDADGSVTTQTLLLELPNGVVCDVHIVGILHDERSDGTGRAGITFMTGPIDVRAMNPDQVEEGGWEASELRAWLDSEGMQMLPQDLAGAIVPVRKATNNVGITNSADSVTVTDDRLWLFSAREVCGEIGWFRDEFGGRFSYLDSVLNAEGEQYEGLEQLGVRHDTDPNHVLALTLAGQRCPWWYRSPYPLNANDASDPGVFYQVMASGFPSSVGQANVAAGVVVGFCL